MSRVSEEDCRRDMKTRSERFDLSRVQITFSTQNFRHDTLAAHLRQLSLRQAMLIHQKR